MLPRDAPRPVYPELPKPNLPRGGFPDLFTADQMHNFADATNALRTQPMASREFLERALAAMEGVIDVADRQTDEFDALRSCVVDLTLMLFGPEALRRSPGTEEQRVMTVEDIMKLADEYAGRSFDQGLHQRTLDEAPEEAREVLRKALAKALHRAQKEGK